MTTYIVVDIETNGPIPGDYSMTSLGAVVIDNKLDKTFKVNIKPISDKSDPSRSKFIDQTDAIDARKAMLLFKEWISKNTSGKIVFLSDNNGFDWMFVCWYFWYFINENPFGYSSQNIQSIYKGIKKDLSVNIDKLRNKELSHGALQYSIDNAKAFLKIKELLNN